MSAKIIRQAIQCIGDVTRTWSEWEDPGRQRLRDRRRPHDARTPDAREERAMTPSALLLASERLNLLADAWSSAKRSRHSGLARAAVRREAAIRSLFLLAQDSHGMTCVDWPRRSDTSDERVTPDEMADLLREGVPVDVGAWAKRLKEMSEEMP